MYTFDLKNTFVVLKIIINYIYHTTLRVDEVKYTILHKPFVIIF